jgi:transposase
MKTAVCRNVAKGNGIGCWPGNTADSALIRQVKDDLREETLARVVWVADRRFASAANRRYLQRAGGHYILGERLRSGSAAAALARPGRYRQVAENLQVKEVRLPEDVGAGDRLVVCFNPEAAERDKAIRERLVAQLDEAIAGTDRLTATKRAELRGQLSTKPGLHRYLKTTPSGLLRLDAKAIAAEAKLDGKFLLRSSDPHLSAEDIAAGYKQLLTVERGWRDMKQTLDLRPVYHRREDRIRAHVLLCWLALLLIRIIETTTGRTWTATRAELQRLHVGTFTGPAGTFRQRTELTAEQRAILTALGLPAPPRVLTAAPAAA